MYYYEGLNESDGPLLCSFSIRCSLSNVDNYVFVFRLSFYFNHQSNLLA